VPYAPELAGPHDPLLETTPRRLRSIRRTTSIDSSRRADGAATDVDARARDLWTGPAGIARTLGEQRLSAVLDQRTAAILEVEAEPGRPGLDGLLGCPVGPGFRQATLDRLDDLVPGSLLAHLLDDWTGAALVSGYAMQREWTEREGPAPPRVPPERFAQMSDICAGWAASGSIMVTLGRTGTVPTPLGPFIPSVEVGPDDLAWHAMPTLGTGSTRRRRRIDLWVVDDATLGFETHFRDSYAEDPDTQSAVHEYVVTGTVGRCDLVISSIYPQVRVLPWKECPSALASADRLVGTAVSALRPLVRREFKGTSTCTHLNDTLRSLQDIATLAGPLERDASG
jgi:hypothetical protein